MFLHYDAHGQCSLCQSHICCHIPSIILLNAYSSAAGKSPQQLHYLLIFEKYLIGNFWAFLKNKTIYLWHVFKDLRHTVGTNGLLVRTDQHIVGSGLFIWIVGNKKNIMPVLSFNDAIGIRLFSSFLVGLMAEVHLQYHRCKPCLGSFPL